MLGRSRGLNPVGGSGESVTWGRWKLKLLNTESEWLEGIYFDRNCSLFPILEISYFPRGLTGIQKRTRILSLLCSLVYANMASPSDLGMAFLLTLMQRLTGTNCNHPMTWGICNCWPCLYVPSPSEKALVKTCGKPREPWSTQKSVLLTPFWSFHYLIF